MVLIKFKQSLDLRIWSSCFEECAITVITTAITLVPIFIRSRLIEPSYMSATLACSYHTTFTKAGATAAVIPLTIYALLAKTTRAPNCITLIASPHTFRTCQVLAFRTAGEFPV